MLILQTIKTSLDQRQSTLAALDEDLASLRRAVEESRPGTSRHHDVEDLEKKASNLTSRWNGVREQADERLAEFLCTNDSFKEIGVVVMNIFKFLRYRRLVLNIYSSRCITELLLTIFIYRSNGLTLKDVTTII